MRTLLDAEIMAAATAQGLKIETVPAHDEEFGPYLRYRYEGDEMSAGDLAVRLGLISPILTNPDGSVIGSETLGWNPFDSVAGAEARYVADAAYVAAHDAGRLRRSRVPALRDRLAANRAACARDAEIVLAALAHVRGTTVEAERASLAARVAAAVDASYMPAR